MATNLKKLFTHIEGQEDDNLNKKTTILLK